MDYKSTNSFLRDFLLSIINKGYSENQICYLLLGQQALQQYKNFLEDPSINLGIKPLDRLYNNLGYDLFLVPVKKGETYPTELQELWNKWYNEVEPNIVEYIDNKTTVKKASKQLKETEDALIDFLKSQGNSFLDLTTNE